MSPRRIAVLVGLLFISATVTFGIGSSLIAAYFSSTSPDEGTLLTSVLLEGGTGLAVAAIGVAMLPVLKPHGKNLAMGYLVLRAAECVAIVAVGTYFATSRTSFENYDLLIYTFSGTAGLVLSFLLLRSKLVAGWLSILGLTGYAVLLAGAASDLLGITDLDAGAGFLFLIPGGLFELAFPLLLIFKGFALVKPGIHDDARLVTA